MGNDTLDVLICGGGLAGLTCALQLRHAMPDLRVTVVEAQARPLPVACHKVGESSVELGTHYLAEVLGLGEYLRREHLPKNGLRFFVGPPDTPIAERTEIGPVESPTVPSFQMDRGKLETDLRRMVEDAGVTLLEGAKVVGLTLGEGGELHVARIVMPDGAERQLTARWLFDAAGRRRLIQRELDMAREGKPVASSAWFRIHEKLEVGALVPEHERRWHARDVDHTRWLSTNHLMGPGYWVWLIPLSTGYTSIGIVTDHLHHDPSSYGRKDKALAWIAEHEPALSRWLSTRELEDFKLLRHYSAASERVFSGKDRWACLGESGQFLDPLYSPGTDFVANFNCVATRLVREDRAGTSTPELADELIDMLTGWTDDCLRTVGDNGVYFGRAEVFAPKLWWDFTHYWDCACSYFFNRGYELDLEDHRRVRGAVEQLFRLNEQAQDLFDSWAELGASDQQRRKAFVGLPPYPGFLTDRHLALAKPALGDALRPRLEEHIALQRSVLQELFLRALTELGEARALGDSMRSAGWRPHLSAERIACEQLPRDERLEHISSYARDMDRAFGRARGDGTPLSTLLTLAGFHVDRGASTPKRTRPST
ncbi:MAG: NAD(P)-binding protein [Deltaproteobacteria bacterium]|nr:NAD(P)-binding protein [Deltaproteobacteria bacterium]